MIAGEKLTPSLTLVRPLAEGGMGSLWVAEHSGLGAEVAVKLMSPVAMEDVEMLERFRREAMAAAQIRSPHVAQVFDHGVTDDGRPYIVMELLEGEDLQARIEREGPLNPKEVVEIVKQVCKALTRAHATDIIHRDIKAANIFLQRIDGELHVKVLDFGVAKIPSKKEQDVSISGFVVGTPYYMSPQQLENSKKVDALSDLWSLAVVTYQALTGSLPFSGRSLPELFVAITIGRFKAPTELRKDLQPEVDAWFKKALHRVPAERFASAKEMAAALEEAVTGSAPRTTDPLIEDPTPAKAPGDPVYVVKVPRVSLAPDGKPAIPFAFRDTVEDEPRPDLPPELEAAAGTSAMNTSGRAPGVSRGLLTMLLVAALAVALIVLLLR
jgi:serine/threonine protein kinase